MRMNQEQIKELLDREAERYNRPAFIGDDPISIPHLFSTKQDIEIMGFFAATLAWGQRKTIIAKCRELSQRMYDEPFRFVTQSSENERKQLLGFKHRTFNDTDLLYFVEFLRAHYHTHQSLEDAFLPGGAFTSMEESLTAFENLFFDSPLAPARTRKHIATPARKSACKRLNMFLRWMVRKDDRGVDFGIWDRIPPKELICPIDVHVERTARKLGLVSRPQPDWRMALELTENLRVFDAGDPVKYDFALFGLSVEKNI